MKRILPLILILCILTGCTGLSPDSHVSLTPHEERGDAAGDDNTVLVEDYLGLRTALMDMIRVGRTDGRIRVLTYDGDVESDLTEAVYGITKQDPLGAYAVDFMTYTCERIVSYYEIDVQINYRRSVNQIAAVKTVSGTSQLQAQLNAALERCATSLVVLVNSYWEQDVAAMTERYWSENPETMLELPQTQVTIYPETGASRIMEIEFQWSDEPKIMLERKKAVADSLDGAANYIRYRKTDQDKIQLLYMYMVGRFNYAPGQTIAPLYSALCDGVAHPWGLSTAWQLICDRAGIECHTVTGRFGEEDRTWNIVCLDGTYRHVDLYRCVTENLGLRLWNDSEMTGYVWTAEDYPVCPAPETPPVDLTPDPDLPNPPIDLEPPPDVQLPVQPQPPVEES